MHYRKREPVAETEQETAWKRPRCPGAVQSRTEPRSFNETIQANWNMQSFGNQDAYHA